MMMKRIDVALCERVIVHKNGKPVRWLGPGRTWEWTLFQSLHVVRLKTDNLVVSLRPEEARLAPKRELMEIVLDPHERAVVYAQGRPARWLKAGQHFVLTVDPSVRVEVVDTRPVRAEPLVQPLRALVAADDYAEVTVPAGCVALRFVDGVLDGELGPGRHAAWTTLRKVHFVVMDLRERLLAVTGQEVMTKDRVSLRLNLSAVFRVADPLKVAMVAKDADEVLYLAVQMAARDAVTARTLDGLLADRDTLAGEILAAVQPKAAELGLVVERCGLKDVVLPGDMKVLLNRVIEATKQAEANVILRREEAAATRQMAQTAKLLAEEPVLMRMKELEAMKELAAAVGQVHVVLGDRGLEGLSLKLQA